MFVLISKSVFFRESCSLVSKEVCEPIEERECRSIPRQVTNQECVTVPERHSDQMTHF